MQSAKHECGKSAGVESGTARGIGTIPGEIESLSERQSRSHVQQSEQSSSGTSSELSSKTTDTVSTMAPTVVAMVFPPLNFLGPHLFLTFFSLAGSNTGAEREVSQDRILAPRSGRSEAQSLDLPPALSTLASGKMGDSRGRRVLPAVLSFCPPAAASPGTRSPSLSAALRGLGAGP